MPNPVQSQVIQLQRQQSPFGFNSNNPFAPLIANAGTQILNKGLDLVGLGYHNPQEDILKEQARHSQQESIRGMLGRGMSSKSVAQAMGMDEEQVLPYMEDREVSNLSAGYADIDRMRSERNKASQQVIPATDPNPATQEQKEQVRLDNMIRTGSSVADAGAAGVLAPEMSEEYQQEVARIRQHLVSGPQRLQQAIQAKEKLVAYWDYRMRNAQNEQNNRLQMAFNKTMTPQNSMDTSMKNDLVAYDQAAFGDYLENVGIAFGVEPAALQGLPLGDLATAMDAQKNQTVETLRALAQQYRLQGQNEAADRLEGQASSTQASIDKARIVFNNLSPTQLASVTKVLSSLGGMVGKSPVLAQVLNNLQSNNTKEYVANAQLQGQLAKASASNYSADKKLEASQEETQGKNDRAASRNAANIAVSESRNQTQRAIAEGQNETKKDIAEGRNKTTLEVSDKANDTKKAVTREREEGKDRRDAGKNANVARGLEIKQAQVENQKTATEGKLKVDQQNADANSKKAQAAADKVDSDKSLGLTKASIQRAALIQRQIDALDKDRPSRKNPSFAAWEAKRNELEDQLELLRK